MVSELKQAIADRDWWRSKIGSVAGWKIYGYNYRNAATFIKNNGVMVEITKSHIELMEAVRKHENGACANIALNYEEEFIVSAIRRRVEE